MKSYIVLDNNYSHGPWAVFIVNLSWKVVHLHLESAAVHRISGASHNTEYVYKRKEGGGGGRKKEGGGGRREEGGGSRKEKGQEEGGRTEEGAGRKEAR